VMGPSSSPCSDSTAAAPSVTTSRPTRRRRKCRPQREARPNRRAIASDSPRSTVICSEIPSCEGVTATPTVRPDRAVPGRSAGGNVHDRGWRPATGSPRRACDGPVVCAARRTRSAAVDPPRARRRPDRRTARTPAQRDPGGRTRPTVRSLAAPRCGGHAQPSPGARMLCHHRSAVGRDRRPSGERDEGGRGCEGEPPSRYRSGSLATRPCSAGTATDGSGTVPGPGTPWCDSDPTLGGRYRPPRLAGPTRDAGTDDPNEGR
jgi:hypothetical protein